MEEKPRSCIPLGHVFSLSFPSSNESVHPADEGGRWTPLALH